jgi:hypothetical protein
MNLAKNLVEYKYRNQGQKSIDPYPFYLAWFAIADMLASVHHHHPRNQPPPHSNRNIPYSLLSCVIAHITCFAHKCGISKEIERLSFNTDYYIIVWLDG